MYLFLIFVRVSMFITEEMCVTRSNGSEVVKRGDINNLNDVNELNSNEPHLMGGIGEISFPLAGRECVLIITNIMMQPLQLKRVVSWVGS